MIPGSGTLWRESEPENRRADSARPLAPIVRGERRRSGGPALPLIEPIRKTRVAEVIVSIMATLNDLLVDSRKRTLKQKGRPRRSILGHEAVVGALRRRDADAASDAMRNHIDQIAHLLQHGPLS